MKTKPRQPRYDTLDPLAFRAWLKFPDGSEVQLRRLTLHEVEKLEPAYGAPTTWGKIERVALFWPIPDDEYEIGLEVK